MTAYADYEYYTETYLLGRSAAVSAADFNFYAMQASTVIDRYTFGNIDAENVPEAVQSCCCELAEILCAEKTSKAAQKEAEKKIQCAGDQLRGNQMHMIRRVVRIFKDYGKLFYQN